MPYTDFPSFDYKYNYSAVFILLAKVPSQLIKYTGSTNIEFQTSHSKKFAIFTCSGFLATTLSILTGSLEESET